MMHIADHARVKDIGVTARKLTRRIRMRQGVLTAQILAQHQRIDLGGRSAHADILVGVGQCLGLHKTALREQLADLTGFADIVTHVAHDSRRVFAVECRDVTALDVGTVLRGDAEMNRHLLQSESGERAVRNIIGMHQKEGIHHMPPEDIEAGIGEGPFPD